jgi:hypothetical protein
MEFTPDELATLFVALSDDIERLDGTEKAYRDACALLDRVSQELKGLAG